MKTEQWADTLLELARADIQSPAYRDYYAITLTRERAGIYLGQLALFIRHRRDCWSYVSGNCPVMSVKRKILEHEYEEVIEDEYSKYGHLDLVVRQAEHIGMSAGEVAQIFVPGASGLKVFLIQTVMLFAIAGDMVFG